MKVVREQMPNTIAFTAGQTVPQVIGSKNYWLAGLWLDFEVPKTDGASPTTTQDFLARIATGISLMGDSNPYIRLSSPDLRPLYWHMRNRLQGRHRMPDMIAGAAKFHWGLPITFGPNVVKFDDSEFLKDTSALVPTSSDLTLSITWGAAGSTTATGGPIGDYRLIGAAVCRVTLIGVTIEAGDPKPTMRPYFFGAPWQPSQNYPGLTGVNKLTPGWFYRRTTVVQRNGSSPADVRLDGMNANGISEIAFQTSDGRNPINYKYWDFAMLTQGQVQVADDNSANAQAGSEGATAAYGTSTTACSYNAGVGMFDWADVLDTSNGSDSPVYGMNLTGKDVGAAQIAMTVDANTNTNADIFHEAYLPL